MRSAWGRAGQDMGCGVEECNGRCGHSPDKDFIGSLSFRQKVSGRFLSRVPDLPVTGCGCGSLVADLGLVKPWHTKCRLSLA